jgi:hypothetical protein
MYYLNKNFQALFRLTPRVPCRACMSFAISTQVVRENSASIVEAVRAVYAEEGNDTPLGAAEWLYKRN